MTRGWKINLLVSSSLAAVPPSATFEQPVRRARSAAARSAGDSTTPTASGSNNIMQSRNLTTVCFEFEYNQGSIFFSETPIPLIPYENDIFPS